MHISSSAQLLLSFLLTALPSALSQGGTPTPTPTPTPAFTPAETEASDAVVIILLVVWGTVALCCWCWCAAFCGIVKKCMRCRDEKKWRKARNKLRDGVPPKDARGGAGAGGIELKNLNKGRTVGKAITVNAEEGKGNDQLVKFDPEIIAAMDADPSLGQAFAKIASIPSRLGPAMIAALKGAWDAQSRADEESGGAGGSGKRLRAFTTESDLWVDDGAPMDDYYDAIEFPKEMRPAKRTGCSALCCDAFCKWPRLANLLMKCWQHKLFYASFFALYFSYMLPFVLLGSSSSGATSDDMETASSQLAPFNFGQLPADTKGGYPWVPGKTCLSFPGYYNLENETQSHWVPVIYGVMHASLLCVALLPIPMCHAFVSSAVRRFPNTVRRYFPVDDLEYVHKLLGVLALGGIGTGATIFIVVMGGQCLMDKESLACAAFTGNKATDPFRNVMILRMIVAPTWFGMLPLMFFAKTNWAALDAAWKKELASPDFSWGRAILWHLPWASFYIKNPPRLPHGTRPCVRLALPFTWCISGLFFGMWFGLVIAKDGAEQEMSQSLGPIVAVVGLLWGIHVGRSARAKLNWFEICYWSHALVAYTSMSVAFIGRSDVFWPCYFGWGLLVLDKQYRKHIMNHGMEIVTENPNNPHNISECIGNVVRLVLRPRGEAVRFNTTNAASQWVYAQVPQLGADRVSQMWHPFSLASSSGGYVELLIGVSKGPNPEGKATAAGTGAPGDPITVSTANARVKQRTWTQHLQEHVKQLLAKKLTRSISHLKLPKQVQVFSEADAMNMQLDILRDINVIGPFGSSFSGCFDLKPEKGGRVAGRHTRMVAKYDAVIVVGGGIGLPSALSALREFIQRKADGRPIPSFVYFVWQCRHIDELDLVWEALHRAIYYDGLQESGDRDLVLGRNWRPSSAMMDWLGISVYISRPKPGELEALKSPAANPLAVAPGKGSGMSESASSLVAPNAAANSGLRGKVHAWLTHERRLQKGYFEVNKILVWLSVKANEAKMAKGGLQDSCSLSVSFCGGPTTFASLKRQIKSAQKHPLMRKGDLDVEFAADHQ